MVGLLMTGFISMAHAVELAYEPFDYAEGFIHDMDGTNGDNGANGGTGWGGGWKNNPAVVTDGSLTAPAGYGLTTMGGKLDMPAIGGSGANRNPTRELGFNIPMNPLVQTEYWVSVLAQRIDDNNQDWGENYWPVELRPSSNGNYYQGGWGTVNDGSDISGLPAVDRQEMVVARNSPGSYVNQTPYEIMNIGSTYLVLINIIANPAGTDNEFRVKTYESGVDTVSGIPTSWDAIAYADRGDVIVRYSMNWGSQTQQILADEIRIGTEFADVVPEPMSLSILGLGTLTWLRRRKH